MVRGRVSVVVPTRNSASTLRALLESVRLQDCSDIESVVVDNHSSDETLAVARELADTVVTAGPERSAQRNRGVDASTGEFVLIVDSDMILTPKVATACLRRHHETGAAAVIVPERTIGDGWLARIRALERSCYVRDDTVEAARFFTREVYVRFGGYDESLTGVEDWDLPARMRSKGETIARVDAAYIDHDERDVRLIAHLKKKFYYAQTALPYLRRHRALAARQAILLRPAYLRHRRRLVQTPLLAAGMIGLKLAESAVGGAGLVVAAVRLRRARGHRSLEERQRT